MEQDTSGPITTNHLSAQVDLYSGADHVQSVPCTNVVPPAMQRVAKGRKSSAKQSASQRYKAVSASQRYKAADHVQSVPSSNGVPPAMRRVKERKPSAKKSASQRSKAKAVSVSC